MYKKLLVKAALVAMIIAFEIKITKDQIKRQNEVQSHCDELLRDLVHQSNLRFEMLRDMEEVLPALQYKHFSKPPKVIYL